MYTRDLLDTWLYSTAATGTSFRDAYDHTCQQARIAHSLRPSLAHELKSNRRYTYEDFSCFLQCLEYHSRSTCKSLFSCAVCEYENADGNTRCKDVVMDGTRTGILGDLPNYIREDSVIIAAKNCSGVQFILDGQ